MSWWMENKLRLIQCNLRETDALMNVDRLIEDIKGFDANTLMIGAGGITALYPTKLDCQYTSPYLESDLLWELVEKCHREGIRVIARFDFSKAHVSFCKDHPNWFYRSLTGETVNFNDMVHTCINGEYQRGISLKIIKEVIELYPVDGIFFNMFGYQTRDYSEHYHGICQCESCKKKFNEMYHLALPTSENDENIDKYREFQKITVHEMLDSIHELVKQKNPDIAVCTYNDYKVDIIRNESNSALSRPLPFWIYSASENVMSVEGSFEDKTVSNCAINAADIFYRFMGVSEHLTKIRLWQNIAAGSGLDYCIIGVFEDYPETAPFEAVREVFSFHKKNEKYFGKLTSHAQVVLIKPDKGGEAEYRGIFKMLKEAHIIFDVLTKGRIKDCRKKYKLAISPSVSFDTSALPEDTHIIATGKAFWENPALLKTLFGAKPAGSAADNKGAYLLADDKKLFKRLPKRDWIFLNGEIGLFTYEGETALAYLPPARYGPPERCGGTEKSGYYGAGIKTMDKRRCIHLPWMIGTLYYRYGYQEHRDILLDLIDSMGDFNPIDTNAPNMAELYYSACSEGDLVQIINLTGYNGVSFFEPLPLYRISITVKNCTAAYALRLRDNEHIPVIRQGDTIRFEVDKLNDYEAFLLPKEEI